MGASPSSNRRKIPIKDVRYLAVGAGAARGFAFIGAYSQLLRYNPRFNEQIRGVIGTSAGAIFSLLFAMKASPARMLKLYNKSDMSAFLGNPSVMKTCNKTGLFDQSKLRSMIAAVMAEQGASPTITFEQFGNIYKCQLHVTSFNLGTKAVEVFSSTNTPEVPVLDAVMASVSMNFIFHPESVVVNGNRECYIDAGSRENVNISTFPVSETLILQLVNANKINKKVNTIYINVGFVPTLNFSPSEEQKKNLYKHGQMSVREYFDTQIDKRIQKKRKFC